MRTDQRRRTITITAALTAGLDDRIDIWTSRTMGTDQYNQGYELGDINGAVERLRAAQALVRSGAANDFIEASVIDARLRQLEGMRRQLAADMRGKLAVQAP